MDSPEWGPAPSLIRACERAHDDDPQAAGVSLTQGRLDQLLAEVSPAKLSRYLRVQDREGLRRLPIIQKSGPAVDRQLEAAALRVVRNDPGPDDEGISPTRTPVSTVLAGGSLAGNDSSIVSSSLSSEGRSGGGDDTVNFRVSLSRGRHKRLALAIDPGCGGREADPCCLPVGIQRDLQHSLVLMAEEVEGLGDVVEREAVRDEGHRVDALVRDRRHQPAHALLVARHSAVTIRWSPRPA